VRKRKASSDVEAPKKRLRSHNSSDTAKSTSAKSTTAVSSDEDYRRAFKSTKWSSRLSLPELSLKWQKEWTWTDLAT